MSDRTQGSVRTGSRDEGAGPQDQATGQPLPVSSTQSIPGASTPRTQGGAADSSPAGSTSFVGQLPSERPGPEGPPKGKSGSRPKGRSRRDGGRGPRRARLQLRHIDTWSALKISLVLSIALFFIWMVAVGVLYGVLNALGVFETLNDLFGQVGSVSGSKSTGDVITPGVVFGGAAVIGAINIVLLTALCTVGTFIYNLCADLVGGLEITLSERD
jgi:hypothetical protein